MKVFIDIGHPHDVHFYKNTIKELSLRGFTFIITARERDCIFDLLNYYQIPFINRGKGAVGIVGKATNLIQTVSFIVRIIKKEKPDLLIGFGSHYIAQTSFLTKTPAVLFNDTEHNGLTRKLYLPFIKTIITPESYKMTHGKKHITFSGYKELAHLHPKYFPSTSLNIKEKLGIKEEHPYAVLRFIAKSAFHDYNYRGFSETDKLLLVKTLIEQGITPVISAEEKISKELEKFQINIEPHLIHYVLQNAEVFIGEGATMAAESVILGTPSIYHYSRFGYLQDLEKNGALYHVKNINETLNLLLKITKNSTYQKKAGQAADNIIKNNINLTDYMIWLIENYPKSIDILSNDPDYQFNFKESQ